jgi:hypothetical protein
MSSRARITTGLALLISVLVMWAREITWLGLPLTFLAGFLIVWGRAASQTEGAMAKLPGGKFMLQGLDHLDMILVPRDHDLENHLRKIIERYDDRRRSALKELLITRNAGPAGSDWTVFNQDGLVSAGFHGPGPIKEEFRESIKRILKKPGA